MPVGSVASKLIDEAFTVVRLGFEVAPSRRKDCERLSYTLYWLPKVKTNCSIWPVERLSARISSPVVQLWAARQVERSRKEPTRICQRWFQLVMEYCLAILSVGVNATKVLLPAG